jgi:hypothetical protein
LNYQDNENDNVENIKINTLPTLGQLLYLGNPISVGDEIAAANIGNLVYVPLANEYGDSYSTFSFSVSDDGSGDYSALVTMTINVKRELIYIYTLANVSQEHYLYTLSTSNVHKDYSYILSGNGNTSC